MRSRHQSKILELLQDTGQELTTKQIQEHFSMSYQMVTRHLRSLTDKKAVIRKARDNGYSYRFKQWPDREREFDPLNPNQMRELIARITSPTWQPNFSKKEVWGIIPQGLLDLEKIYNQATHGEKVKRDQVDRIKQELRSIMGVLDSTRNILGRILATDDMWDHTTLTAFLGEGSVNV